jgi:hypothetical protein
LITFYKNSFAATRMSFKLSLICHKNLSKLRLKKNYVSCKKEVAPVLKNLKPLQDHRETRGILNFLFPGEANWHSFTSQGCFD